MFRVPAGVTTTRRAMSLWRTDRRRRRRVRVHRRRRRPRPPPTPLGRAPPTTPAPTPDGAPRRRPADAGDDRSGAGDDGTAGDRGAARTAADGPSPGGGLSGAAGRRAVPDADWPTADAAGRRRSGRHRRRRRRGVRRARRRGAGALRRRRAGRRDRLRALPPARRPRRRSTSSFSVAKSFTSALIGLLVDDGVLTLDEHPPRARVAGAGDPAPGDHAAPAAADVERPGVDRGVRRRTAWRSQMLDARRRGGADGRPAARDGAGFDVRVLDRARRRWSPASPPTPSAAAPRSTRTSTSGCSTRSASRPSRSCTDGGGCCVGGFGMDMTTARLRPLRPALPARRAVGRPADPADVVGRRDPGAGGDEPGRTACTGGSSREFGRGPVRPAIVVVRLDLVIASNRRGGVVPDGRRTSSSPSTRTLERRPGDGRQRLLRDDAPLISRAAFERPRTDRRHPQRRGVLEVVDDIGPRCSAATAVVVDDERDGQAGGAEGVGQLAGRRRTART